MSPVTLETARAWAERRLSADRFAHVQRVVELGRHLARLHGEQPDRVALAGWLHDLAREEPPEALLAEARRRKWQLDEAEMADPLLLHGKVAAAEAAEGGVTDDEEILEAVRWHTTAHPGWGRVGCLLFLADKLEPGRRFAGIDDLRRLAVRDLDQAMRAVLDALIQQALNRGYWLPVLTVQARNRWLFPAGTGGCGAKS